MANLLELVQLLHDESGSSGSRPATAQSQTGENLRKVNWVKNADYEIQSMWHDWKFLRDTSTFSSTTSTDQSTISKPSTLKIWDEETIRMDGELIEVVEYDAIKGEVLDTTSAQPSRLIILYNNDLQIDPPADGAYTFTGDFFKKPYKMSANADESPIPEEFHETVILGKALMYYGRRENAGEIYDKGLELFEDNIGILEDLQLPNNHYSRYRSSASNPIEVIAE